MESHIKCKLLMRWNKTFLWRNVEYVFTEVKIPLESGRYVSYVADYEPFCEFGVNSNWTKVNLILNIFQINTMTTTSYSAQLPYFLILHNFIAQRHCKLVLALRWSITDFYLLSFPWIYGQLVPWCITQVVLFKLLYLREGLRNFKVEGDCYGSFAMIYEVNYFGNFCSDGFDAKVDKFVFCFHEF